jgi:hypothetical protein
MKLSEQKKVLPLLLLALALIVAPQLHSSTGCGDEDDASPIANTHDTQLSRQVNAPQTHDLPDGACCALDHAVDVLAYSTATTSRTSFADSATAALVALTQVAALLAPVKCAEVYHPPPLSTPVFIELHSLLI